MQMEGILGIKRALTACYRLSSSALVADPSPQVVVPDSRWPSADPRPPWPSAGSRPPWPSTSPDSLTQRWSQSPLTQCWSQTPWPTVLVPDPPTQYCLSQTLFPPSGCPRPSPLYLSQSLLWGQILPILALSDEHKLPVLLTREHHVLSLSERPCFFTCSSICLADSQKAL